MKKLFFIHVVFILSVSIFANANSEGPQIRVTETVLENFTISRTEMSVAEAVELLNAGLSRNYIVFVGRGLKLANGFGDMLTIITGEDMEIEDGRIVAIPGKEHMPVRYISNLGAAALCNIKSLEEGLEPYYDYYFDTNPWAKGYRLPSIQEWETAAKGGDNRSYAWGDGIAEAGAKANTAYMFTGKSYDYERITFERAAKEWAVTEGLQNPYGLYNMTGNLSEWTSDVFDSPDKNVGLRKYHKGGSFFHSTLELNIDHEIETYACNLLPYVTFRWVRSN